MNIKKKTIEELIEMGARVELTFLEEGTKESAIQLFERLSDDERNRVVESDGFGGMVTTKDFYKPIRLTVMYK